MNVDDVAGELYGLPPAEFIAARTAKVREARGSGDRQLATAIGQLRRPTVSAAIVNHLTRNRRDLVDDLLELGAELRRAQTALAGDDLRRLSARRNQVVARLVEEGRRLSAELDQPLTGQVEDELTATLQAALADPDTADAVRSGRLTSALQYSGFGLAVGDGETGLPRRSARQTARPRPTATAAPKDASAGREAKAAATAALAAATSRLDDAELAHSRAEEALSGSQRGRRDASEHITELEGPLRQARDDERHAAKAVRAKQKDRDRALRAVQAARKRVEQAQRSLDR